MIFHQTSMYPVEVYNLTGYILNALATQTFRDGLKSEIECAKVSDLNSLIY